MNNFINTLFKNYQPGLVNKIRPKTILKEIEDLYKTPINMQLYAPSSEIGSLTTLESTMLICILKILKPKLIFEYGTFLGYSTSIFLKNTPSECKTISIDLGKKIENVGNIDVGSILLNDKVNDDYLRIIQAKSGPIYVQDEIDKNNGRLELLYGDSKDISVEKIGIEQKVNFVFIDGGHTYDIIESDTKNAFKMVKNGIIVWHDYGSKIHGDVTKFVDTISTDKKIFHIENTMLSFHIVE